MTPPSLATTIAEALTAYAGSPSLDQFLTERVGSDKTKTILDFLERVDAREEELRVARGTMSTARWLGEVVAAAGPLPDSVTSRLETFAHNDEVGSPEDTGRRILDASVAALGVGAESLGGTDDDGAGLLDMVVEPKAAALVDGFFRSPIGHSGEKAVVAAASAGVIDAAERLKIAGDTTQITAVVDLGFRVAKAGYKLASGDLSSEDDALDRVTDRVAAQIGAVAGEAVERAAPEVGAAVGAYLESFLPMGGLAIQAGRALGSMAGKALRPVVESGIRIVTKTLVKAGRELLRHAGQVAKAGMRKVSAWLFGG